MTKLAHDQSWTYSILKLLKRYLLSNTFIAISFKNSTNK